MVSFYKNDPIFKTIMAFFFLQIYFPISSYYYFTSKHFYKTIGCVTVILRSVFDLIKYFLKN